jgi:predicted nucleic acid-binding Zn finger protein
VHLLGTGFPNFWVASMGEMRLTLGLSGWTKADWTRASALDALSPPYQPPVELLQNTAAFVRKRQSATLGEVHRHCLAAPGECAAALNQLAQTGQVMYDLEAAAYRWRQIMPQALGEAEMGPPNPEIVAARSLRALVTAREPIAKGMLIRGEVNRKPIEVVINADDRIAGGKCGCSHHHQFGIRQGPCRHILALRRAVFEADQAAAKSLTEWYERRSIWAQN